MKQWNDFAKKYPKAAQWVREGGLFVIVCNLITVFKYAILTFLPAAFKSLWAVNFGWPGIQTELFKIPFVWNIFGYAVVTSADGTIEVGGLGYFIAYMIAMIIGEVANFPVQKYFVFQNKEGGAALAKQILAYIAAFCVITVVVNSVNCIWVAVAGNFVPDWLYNIGTIVLNGGVSMVVFFFVNKVIFPSAKERK